MQSQLDHILQAPSLDECIANTLTLQNDFFVRALFSYILQKQLSNTDIKSEREVVDFYNAMLARYGNWQNAKVLTRDMVLSFLKTMPETKQMVMEHIITNDDVNLAKFLESTYYQASHIQLAAVESNKNEYLLWLEVIDKYRLRQPKSEAIPQILEWFYHPNTLQLLANSRAEVIRYIEVQQDFDLCYQLIVRGALDYRELALHSSSDALIGHLLDAKFYRSQIVCHTSLWLERVDLDLEFKWFAIEANLKRVTPVGNLQEYITAILANYGTFADQFIEQASAAIIALKYKEQYNYQDWGVQQFIAHLIKRWPAENQNDALVILASFKPELLVKLRDVAIALDDVGLLQVLTTYCASLPVPLPEGLRYWDLVEAVNGAGAARVAAEIYSIRMLKLLHSTSLEALEYLLHHPNPALCRHLIKHDVLDYLQALKAFQAVPELATSLLEPPFFYQEMLSHKTTLLEEYAALLTSGHMEFLQKGNSAEYLYSGSEKARHANYLQHHIIKVLKLFTAVAADSDIKLMQHLLYMKRYDQNELKHYSLLLGDIDTAIILLVAHIGDRAWQFLRRYIIDYDDTDLLQAAVAYGKTHPQAASEVEYLQFVDALHLDHKHKVGIYLSNTDNFGNLFKASALIEYIAQHNDMQLCDIAIQRGILSYPEVWQVANQTTITVGDKLLIDHLLDYRYYRHHLVYYRQYLLENNTLSSAAKLAIKQPVFVHEAVQHIATFQKQYNAPELTLRLLAHNIYKLLAVAFEENSNETELGYIAQSHTPLAIGGALVDVLYKVFNQPISWLDQHVIQPIVTAGNFLIETIAYWIQNIPELLNPFDLWHDMIDKKKYVEWVLDMKSMNLEAVTSENTRASMQASLEAYTGKVISSPQHMHIIIPELRKLLGHLHLEQQIHLEHKKKIIMDTVQVLIDYAKQGKVSYELLKENDVFGIGGGINQHILHPDNQGFNVAHPLYRLLYVNPAPLIVEAIPGMSGVARSLSSWLYPEHQLPVIIIPNEVSWYMDRINIEGKISEEEVISFYVKHAPLEAWHQIIKTTAGSGLIKSPALDVFRVLRHDTEAAGEILRDIASMVVRYQSEMPSTFLNMAYLYRDMMSEVDWTAYHLIHLMHQQVVTPMCELLFSDYNTLEGKIAFAQAKTILNLTEDMAHQINRVQYDERHMVKLAYFIARCKMAEYMKAIIPRAYAVVSANQSKLVQHSEIPKLWGFARELLSSYLAPLDQPIKPFYLANLPTQIGLLKTPAPCLEVVRDIVLHGNPMDDVNHYIAAAASQMAPAAITQWLMESYAHKFYVVPLGLLTEEEKRNKTKILSKDMTVWVEGALSLMQELSKLQPTALERLDEQRYKWWQGLRLDIGKKISIFFEAAGQYFDSDQYARATVAAMSANHAALNNEVPVPALFLPIIREQIMIALNGGVSGASAVLKYMMYNDMIHALDYKFAAFNKGGAQFYNTSVRPVIKEVMHYISTKILPKAEYDPASGEWLRQVAREDEVLYTLDMVNYFDGQDKIELWADHVNVGGMADPHTMLYRMVQSYLTYPIILARAIRDNEVVRLFLRHVNEKMVNPKYLKINGMMTALDVIHRNLDLINAKTAQHSALYNQTLELIRHDLCHGDARADFLYSGKVLSQLHQVLDSFYDPFYKNMPIDVISNKQYEKFEAVRKWVVSLNEIEQAEALVSIEFLALYEINDG